MNVYAIMRLSRYPTSSRVTRAMIALVGVGLLSLSSGAALSQELPPLPDQIVQPERITQQPSSSAPAEDPSNTATKEDDNQSSDATSPSSTEDESEEVTEAPVEEIPAPRSNVPIPRSQPTAIEPSAFVTGSRRDEIEAYDDGGGTGFTLESDKQDRRHSLTISGRVQARYTYFDDKGPFENPTMSAFEMERVRLGFRGFIYKRYLRYNIGTDWDNDGLQGAPDTGGLLNAFVDVRLQEAIGIGWGDRTTLRMGFWRTNFGRQTAESSKRLQFVDRSITSNVFNLGTNAGIALLGEFTHYYRPVRYELALLNGFGTSGNNPRTGTDNHSGVALRVYEDVIGDYQIGEGDNRLSEFQALRLGASFAFTRRERRGRRGAPDEFDDPPAILLATDVAQGIPFFRMDELRGAEREYDLWLWGLEASWKHCGWSLHTEYLFRIIDNVRFESNHEFRDFTHGFYVQGGYFLTEQVEVTARHSAVFSHGRGSGSPIRGGYDNSAHATGGSLNFYFRGHNSKFQIDAFYYDGAPITSSSMNIIAGDRGTMVRAQYQLSF